MIQLRGVSSAGRIVVAAALLTLIGTRAGESQTAGGLTVEPVGLVFAHGQTTTVLNVTNNTGREVDFQVRPYAWTQPAGADQLTPTDQLAVSPPISRIPAGGKQVARLVLRRSAQDQEGAFRVVFDQVPPPKQPGVVNFVFRLSIPAFAEPTTAHAAPRVSWSLQPDGRGYSLVAVNSGARHDEFRDIALKSADGRSIAVDQRGSPYVLPGSTRRWRVVENNFSPAGKTLRVTARAESGPVDQPLAGP